MLGINWAMLGIKMMFLGFLVMLAGLAMLFSVHGSVSPESTMITSPLVQMYFIPPNGFVGATSDYVANYIAPAAQQAEGLAFNIIWLGLGIAAVGLVIGNRRPPARSSSPTPSQPTASTAPNQQSSLAPGGAPTSNNSAL